MVEERIEATQLRANSVAHAGSIGKNLSLVFP
jgi:hypothetical protein